MTISAIESSERFPRVSEVGWFQTADRLDDIELRKFVQTVKLPHALFGKCDLIHRVGLSVG
jgi:hypothetical protein